MMVTMPAVAPLAGAWIETPYTPDQTSGLAVAPLAGAWIETIMLLHDDIRERVAPLAGAWIETVSPELAKLVEASRPPRGGVD